LFLKQIWYWRILDSLHSTLSAELRVISVDVVAGADMALLASYWQVRLFTFSLGLRRRHVFE